MFCTIDKHLLKSHWKKGGSLQENHRNPSKYFLLRLITEVSVLEVMAQFRYPEAHTHLPEGLAY